MTRTQNRRSRRALSGRRYAHRRSWGANQVPAQAQADLGYDTQRTRLRRYQSFARDRAEFAVAGERDRTELREGCRQQDRVNSVFQRVLNATIENVIGTGPRFVPNSADPDWNLQAEAILEVRFGEYHFTPTRNRSEWEQSKLALRVNGKRSHVVGLPAVG
jgi:hypothetical protein